MPTELVAAPGTLRPVTCSATSRTGRTTGSCCPPCSRAPTTADALDAAGCDGTPSTARALGTRVRRGRPRPSARSSSPTAAGSPLRPARAGHRRTRPSRRSAAWSGSTAGCTPRCTPSARSTTAAPPRRGARRAPAVVLGGGLLGLEAARALARPRPRGRGRRGGDHLLRASSTPAGRGPRRATCGRLGTERLHRRPRRPAAPTSGLRPRQRLHPRHRPGRAHRRRPAVARRWPAGPGSTCAAASSSTTSCAPATAAHPRDRRLRPARATGHRPRAAGLGAGRPAGRAPGRRSDVAYDGTRSVTRLRATGLDVAVLGDPERTDGEVVEVTNPVGGSHRKLVVRDGVIVGRHPGRRPVPGRPDHPALRPAHVLGPPEPGALLHGRPARASRLDARRRRRGLRLRRRHAPAGSAPAPRSTRSATTTRATTGCGGCADRRELSPAAVTITLVQRNRPDTRDLRRTRRNPRMSPHLRRTRRRRPRHGRPPVRPGRVERGLTETPRRRRLGEEPRPAYDRVALTSFFEAAPTRCRCCPRASTTTRGSGCCSARAGRGARPRDPDGRCSATARCSAYDALVLATGSAPFVPPVPGRDLPGCFVYRTIDDLEAIREAAATAPAPARWSAAGCSAWRRPTRCVQLGLDTHVVEMAPRLMPVQVDDAGGATLVRHIEALGADRAHRRGDRAGRSADGQVDRAGARRTPSPIDADVVVFSAGIRPRDELAREAGLEVGERGGVLVDEQCRTVRPARLRDRRVRGPGGRMYGLVAPGYAMAEVVADRLLGGAGHLHRRRHVDQAQAARRRRGELRRRVRRPPRARSSSSTPTRSPASTRSWSSPTTAPLLGGILVGDASAYGVLRPMVASGHRAARQPGGADPPGRPRRPSERRAARRGAGLLVQRRHQAADHRRGRRGRLLRHAVLRQGVHPGRHDLRLVRADGEEARRGVLRAVGRSRRPEHVRALPADPAGAVRHRRGARLPPFDDIVAAHGTGRGCDICKPAVASILATPVQRPHPRRRRPATLQDTNDPYLANIQRNGTYSRRARGSPAARSRPRS